MGYDHSRMLFYKDTGEVSPEVYDVLLYQILRETNPADMQRLYEAHMRGDVASKQAIHQQYYPQTAAALTKHVNGFLNDLNTLKSKSIGKDPAEHPRLPLIMAHNEFVRETFERVSANL
jgi:dihydrodipicolinate synthase/N-acetylneuraminate lyase